MTTFQDPPPQSRRSARQNERGEQQPETPPFVQFSGEQPSFAADPAQPDATPTSGRRARAEQPEVAPEPLNYTTQGAPSVNYESLPPPAGYTPTPQDPTGYRVRDFSPEGSGRRAAAPPLIEPQQTFAAGAADLDYRTQAGPAAPAVAPAQAPSRREMRQRQAEAEAAAAPTVAPVSAPQAAAPPQQYQAAPPPAASAPAPAMAPPPPLGAPSTMTAPPPQQSSPPNALSNAMAEFEALTRTGQAPPPALPLQAPPPAPQQQAAPPPMLEPQLEQTGGWVAPVGHWSRQADLDDETQPWENTITREVGGGNVATTTSALVLPEIPRPSNFSTALDSTGEVLLTGSIDLPQSLSTGGGDPRRYDDPNVDRMYDTQDAEFTGTDSSPVRAIRAVSTHTSSRGVIHANKPHGNRMIVVVFIATAVLAVSVVGLFIASVFLNVF